jgi:hypothetical protein
MSDYMTTDPDMLYGVIEDDEYYIDELEQKVYDYEAQLEAMRRADEDRRSMAVAAHAFVAALSALAGLVAGWAL